MHLALLGVSAEGRVRTLALDMSGPEGTEPARVCLAEPTGCAERPVLLLLHRSKSCCVSSPRLQTPWRSSTLIRASPASRPLAL